MVPLLAAPLAHARTHRVVKGDTLIGLGKRYGVSYQAIQRANGLRGTIIRIGQRLKIPQRKTSQRGPRRAPGGPRKAGPMVVFKGSTPRWARRSARGLNVLHLPRQRPVFVYPPRGPAGESKAPQPVLVYFHARHGQPRHDCRRWAPLATRYGWLACPTAPARSRPGRFTWHNAWRPGARAALAALKALRARFPERVRRRGHTIMGFSEGAVVALNVGVRHPRTFSRWLIQAGRPRYLGSPGFRLLRRRQRKELRRVLLLTGRQDAVFRPTRELARRLAGLGVSVKSSLPPDLGHELALERKRGTYRAALSWLQRP